MKNQPRTDVVHLKTGSCPSLSGKSKLKYAVGRSPEGRLQLRVVENSSTGCFGDDWFEWVCDLPVKPPGAAGC